MNVTEKRYAIKRIEDTYYTLMNDLRPNHTLHHNAECMEELLKRKLIRVPSVKEVPEMLRVAGVKGINHFFPGYDEYYKIAKIAHKATQIRYDAYCSKLRTEINTISDEIMLAKQCNLAELFARLNKIKI